MTCCLVFTNRDCDQLHFVYPSFEGRQPALRRMVVTKGLPRRTLVQQISNVWSKWRESGDIRAELEIGVLDVEAVTADFFREYKRIYGASKVHITGFGDDEAGRNQKKRLRSVRYSNRFDVCLLLIAERVAQVSMVDNDYLRALWGSYASDDDQCNFYVDRLKHLFLSSGLNNPSARDLIGGNSALSRVIGDVPFLNGGLFDKSDLDDNPGVVVPDDAIEPILSQLFDRFNFTVMESTPLDVEVAVDPEMLGKVF